MIKFFILVISCILLSGAGYSGVLPDLNQSVKNTSQNTDNSETEYLKSKILPLAPTPPYNYYSDPIIVKGKYSEYLKDVKNLIPLLENLKELLVTKENMNLQFFSAKANFINIYVNYLNEKYNKKPEQNYESYKQILRLNKYIAETNEYWIYTHKYNKYLRGSVNDIKKDQEIINKKLNEALISTNKVLDILKSNFED